MNSVLTWSTECKRDRFFGKENKNHSLNFWKAGKVINYELSYFRFLNILINAKGWN